LMCGRIGAVAAVRVCRVTVGLDVARVGALEASGTRGESRCLTRADIVGKTGNVTWVTHEDGGLYLLLSSRGDRDGGARKALVGVTASTVGIIEDLTTLRVSD